ncbi:NAD(P)/FAD-dependent oxidoreductase [Bacillus atrophaeus]|uniref:NAD(P)/FAD-dependent oxidoreductase n=1 Tax=Bacillus atrophaeus TaxID=1452 RepID=UPI001239B28D|nr:tryptophan 7-halogenase [Bacillus atrophaeus]KAA6453974.1 FAD-dependent oxidoreductase [Bacillus atrophaeus]
MSINYNADVTVVGGGPAGAAAAISCAQMDLKVIIIEREQFPRYRPGETLHPGIEPLLKELGVEKQVCESGFLRHTGNWVQWDGERHFLPFGSDEAGQWLGFQAWRADFDAILLEQAISLGVEVRQPCRALRPIISHNRVVGVVTSEGEVRSSFVIDATGRRQWLAQKLKLSINRYSPRLIVNFGYGEGECPVRDCAPAIVADNKGWTWTARVRPQLYQWTRLSFVNEALEKGWLPKEFQGLKPINGTKGAEVTWRTATKCGGLGYFLVGDAAAVLDPASSHGVLKAVMSGMMAGHLITQIMKEGQREDYVTQGYCKWIFDWFEHDVKELKKRYTLLSYFQEHRW